MDTLNKIQLKILTRLLFNPQARFRDLNADLLTTDHFSYHLKSLLRLGLIKKNGTLYGLTSRGKMLAGKVDTETHSMEKQPKISVILIPHRRFGKVEKYLIQQRTKEPYFGYWGFIAGKIRFGETLGETAKRELLEEAGIVGQSRFCYEIHEMVYDRDSSEQLEDKYFHIIEVLDPEGNLVEKTKEGKNVFMTEKEFREISPKFHNEDDLFSWFLNKDFKLKEEKYYIDRF